MFSRAFFQFEMNALTLRLFLLLVLLQVVLNKAISKTQKVRFFTAAVLAHIASLYKWNGIVDATTDDSRVSY